eukprot:9024505-Pyramimonas_sp.AAC.3
MFSNRPAVSSIPRKPFISAAFTWSQLGTNRMCGLPSQVSCTSIHSCVVSKLRAKRCPLSFHGGTSKLVQLETHTRTHTHTHTHTHRSPPSERGGSHGGSRRQP